MFFLSKKNKTLIFFWEYSLNKAVSLGTSCGWIFVKNSTNLQLIYTCEKTSKRSENHYTCVKTPYNLNGAIENRGVDLCPLENRRWKIINIYKKYSENFQISKNFDFWKHFFILYQIKISLQFFCFFFQKILHLFLGSDQMLNPHNCSRFGIRNILNHRFSSRSGSTHRFSSPPFDPQWKFTQV